MNRKLKSTGRIYNVRFTHEIEYQSIEGKPEVLSIPDSKVEQTWEDAKANVQQAMGWQDVD